MSDAEAFALFLVLVAILNAVCTWLVGRSADARERALLEREETDRLDI